jgi:hypothetical protein
LWLLLPGSALPFPACCLLLAAFLLLANLQ